MQRTLDNPCHQETNEARRTNKF